jgi:predicted Abi (CAAX) family protease
MVMVTTVAPDLWTLLRGVLTLDGQAFVAGVYFKSEAPLLAFLVVLIAGFSVALGQSVVLFANRVKPARFVLSLLVSALLFVFSYAFLALSTWAFTLLYRDLHLSLADLLIVLAFSYAPLAFSFLEPLPYLGIGIGWALRTWSLLAMVVGLAAVGGISFAQAMGLVVVGWLVLATAQQTIGRPIAHLGQRVMDWVSGVRFESDEARVVEAFQDAQQATQADPDGAAAAGRTGVAVGEAVSNAKQPDTVTSQAATFTTAASGNEASEAGEFSADAALGAGTSPESASRSPSQWRTMLTGIVLTVALAVFVSVALGPLRGLFFGWAADVPGYLRLPLDLAWLVVIALIVAGLVAPLQTLGWWAGWYGDQIKPAAAQPSKGGRGKSAVLRYVVYLDGIGQSSGKYTPDIEVFLDALAPRLPRDVRLVRGLMAYSVLNRPLDDDPVWSFFWKFVDKLRLANPDNVLGLFINLRNVLIVGVSADARYGPIYNYGIAQRLHDGLIADGYEPRSGVPVTLMGYSGGGQMSVAAAPFLRRALDAPVDVISLGGVMSGSERFLDLEHLYHLVGDKDKVEPVGPMMFWSRWKIFALSNWNRGLRLGRISRRSLGPVEHQVPGGMFDPNGRLENGKTYLQHTNDTIVSIVRGRFQTHDPKIAARPSNYDLYVKAAWNRPEYYPMAQPVDVHLYHPIGEWMGRLILPKREERSAVRGAWFEVHHADAEHQRLIGSIVKLRWGDDPAVAEMARAVTRDVFFSADADNTLRTGDWVLPVRLRDWQLVGPLESLAGARPSDDVVVRLAGPVEVEEDPETVLRITREPVQISGMYYGLVRFVAPLDGDRYRVVHFSAATGRFDGPEEIVSMPPAVADTEKRPPSSVRDLERSPAGEEGWYIYGALDARGTFVVRSLAPRALLRVHPQASVPGNNAAYRFVRKEAWGDIVARKGTVRSTLLNAVDGQADAPGGWREGDRALVVHTFGGIGGEQSEASARGPVYFGHFAYGEAQVVKDPLAGELRFEIVYHQVYSHNTDGLVAGALHWSRYMGDRQFGWAGVRPTCDIVLKLDAFTGEFPLDAQRSDSALAGLIRQLEAMEARYRIGDGTGCTYVGPANNCAQDSNRALFETLRNLRAAVENQADFQAWKQRYPEQLERLKELVAVTDELAHKLQIFGVPRSDWSANAYNLGRTMDDQPVQQVLSGLGSWRMIFPRFASDTIVRTFFAHGASAWVLSSVQVGGVRPEIEPVAPMTF